MNDSNSERLSFRTVIAVAAEVSAVLTLMLTWWMYQESKKVENASTAVNTALVVTTTVSLLSLTILVFITIRTLLKKVKNKSHTLNSYFSQYVNSDPAYLRGKETTKKKALLQKTKIAIKKLDESKAFEQDVYYMILYALFTGVTDTINVVSILDDNEWVDTPEEDEFLRVNLAVKERKIHINRIFAVYKSDVARKLNTKSIQSFIEEDRTYLHLFVVFFDDLPRNIVNDIGSGYIDFAKFSVACDVFSDNEIRGYLKTDAVEVDRYYKNFMKLTGYYHPLNKEFEKKYLSKTSNNVEATPSQTDE